MTLLGLEAICLPPTKTSGSSARLRPKLKLPRPEVWGILEVFAYGRLKFSLPGREVRWYAKMAIWIPTSAYTGRPAATNPMFEFPAFAGTPVPVRAALSQMYRGRSAGDGQLNGPAFVRTLGLLAAQFDSEGPRALAYQTAADYRPFFPWR
jgi:hypothetical protein